MLYSLGLGSLLPPLPMDTPMPHPARRDPTIPYDFMTALGRGLFDQARSYSRMDSTAKGDIWLVKATQKTFYVRAWRYEMEDLGIQER